MTGDDGRGMAGQPIEDGGRRTDQRAGATGATGSDGSDGSHGSHGTGEQASVASVILEAWCVFGSLPLSGSRINIGTAIFSNNERTSRLNDII